MSNDGKSQNLLFILSDEHNRKIAGCYGHPFVKTPNLDRLAAGGTIFSNAYCNSPICVPSRASLATGRYVHEIRCWDNASPYTGRPKSWHSTLREQGVDVVSIGKLHFRGGDDYGFTEELAPLHVVGGKGDLKGLFRKELPPKSGTANLAAEAGPGDSSYARYDTKIGEIARDWLKRRAAAGETAPFVLMVSFVMPHFPLVVSEAYYDLYRQYEIEDLTHGLDAPPPDHPTLNRMLEYFDYDGHFDDESKAAALRAYFGMVTRLDELIGEVLTCLDETGLSETTRVLYTSDHGDNLGNRGMWGKSVMYEDSVGVPMILAGDGVPAGKTVKTPVSLLDIGPTAAAATRADLSDEDLPGESLIALANAADSDRAVFAEYHASGSDTGQFMIRKGHWKYVFYVDTVPQLFNLEQDPDELVDLGTSPEHAPIRAQLDAALRQICNPEAEDARAFADQMVIIRANGGKEGIASSADIPFTPVPV